MLDKNGVLHICAGRCESLRGALPLGVGPVEMAMGLGALLARYGLDGGAFKGPSGKPKLESRQKPQNEQVRAIVFYGSAGVYDASFADISEIFIASQAANIELGLLENLCYTPLEARVEGSDSLASRLYEALADGTNSTCELSARPLGELCVNSSSYITTSRECAKGLMASGCALENMEFYAVLSVAKAFSVRGAGVFCVSNAIRPNAHEAFISNIKTTNAKLELAIEAVKGVESNLI